MESSLNNLKSALEDINALLDLSNSEIGSIHKSNILRSTIVLMVASWEQFIEQLAENTAITIVKRLRDSEPIPEGVKQSIAIYAVKENRSNKRDFSKSVWQIADKGWKTVYVQYCKESTKKINSAYSENIQRLYEDVFGIRDVTSSWSFNALTSDDCASRLDDLVNMRHDIAHGANLRASELTDGYVNNLVEFLTCIAAFTHQLVNAHATHLCCQPGQGIQYSLTNSCYVDIISAGIKKPDRVLTIKEIKILGSSAQGNHNKLRYEPWGLLDFVDGRTRRVTDKMVEFHNDNLKLPLNILVFDNGDAIPAPNTPFITYAEMLANQREENDETDL